MFTILFEGDIKDIKGNPFKVETPFGRPKQIATEDVMAYAERLEEALEKIETFSTDELSRDEAREALATGKSGK